MVSSLLLAYEVEIPVIGLLNLMLANEGVDHSPNHKLNAMFTMAGAYTQLVLPQ